MHSARRYDVVVVGAGPVGLTAALLLERGGARVALIEAAERPGDLPRAISIADETFRIMSRLGIADALKAESLLDTGSRYFGRNDRLLASSRPVPSRIGHPAKSQFDQPVLEELLWDRAASAPGIDFLTGRRAVAITQNATGVTATLEQGDPAAPDSVTGDWLIGADGGRSFVRDALGVPLVGSTQQERWIVIDLLDVPGQREPFAEFHGNGTRPYVLVPGIKGRLRLEYMLFAHEDPDVMTAPARILELVRPFHPHVRPEHIRRAAVYVAHQRVARSYRVGRAFLVGDAAHLMPPFSGQGLNAGLRDALNISWKLLEARRGVAGPRLLDTYQSERRRHGAKMMKISRRTGAVVMAVGRVRAGARDALFRTVSVVPAVHEYLARMRFITPPDYRNGVAVPASRDIDRRLAAWVGFALGQPTVAAADGRTSPLDDHLGEGWALVELGGGAEASPTDPYWAALGTQYVRLTREAASASALHDTVGMLALPDLQQPHWVVVRPDRFVAAVFTRGSERAVIRALRAYVDPEPRSSDHGNDA
ncbi:FAD-dependent monooxygenase [Leifsonia sp. H3M29-4]|uniref:FAD-dependent monooxygenase n=1 Tax=Salinibacterium metalliresistens TaxID=3031321 RepID=UPI0023D9F49C|nr:FAD-dependent monooxygenase [Salinibacterium metalliresistens]MDF1477679.1 FAD-dependent monooxygenase [Salinibacterium metalliresistens]